MLSTLKLNLHECKKIHDKSVKALFYNLRYLEILSSLDLDFSPNDNISNKCFEQLSSSFEQIALLSRINLKFSHCRKITDVAINGILSSLENHKLLVLLSLDFSGGCPIMTNKRYNSLLSFMNSNATIQRLIFDAQHYQEQSDIPRWDVER